MKKTLSLTYGAMTVALTGIILFFDRITAGFFMTFLALPLIVYGSYCDWSDAFVVYLSCIIMAVIMSGLFSTVLMMAGYGAVGLAYIYSMKKNASPSRSYLAMGVVIALFYFIMIRFFWSSFWYGLSRDHSICERDLEYSQFTCTLWYFNQYGSDYNGYGTLYY
ncbi:DUF2232 domain-containing protein [Erysipelothrix rhusiopathiae]|nr:DUF2232 domain-containing protein [Erysipelothrix rhusiopathiae]